MEQKYLCFNYRYGEQNTVERIEKAKLCCGNCRYFYHDDNMLDDDYVCVNHLSDHVADYAFERDSCKFWEAILYERKDKW